MSRTQHPKEKGTELAYRRWRRRNLDSKPGNRPARDVRHDYIPEPDQEEDES